MVGGGPFDWEPGEWTDDTSMAIPIARIAARGDDLIEHIPELIGVWRAWLSEGPKDVGVQTRAVLDSLTSNDEAEAHGVSERFFRERGRAAGNGALMRTASVALAYLDDPARMAEAARRIAQLTHFEADAWEACVLWCEAIRRAVLTGHFLPHAGLGLLPESSRTKWDERISAAITSSPVDFPENGWVVHALQAAIASINTSKTASEAIETAVRAGGDSDTVGAICGALAGALQGVQSLPMAWKTAVHGWPGLAYQQLMEFAVLAVNRGQTHQSNGWPLCERIEPTPEAIFEVHPDDDGVFLGNLATLDDSSSIDRVDAAIALCRVGQSQIPNRLSPTLVWLIDSNIENLNLDYVLDDLSDLIIGLRNEGKRVLIFCHAGLSRTPLVAEHLGKRIRESCPS